MRREPLQETLGEEPVQMQRRTEARTSLPWLRARAEGLRGYCHSWGAREPLVVGWNAVPDFSAVQSVPPELTVVGWPGGAVLAGAAARGTPRTVFCFQPGVTLKSGVRDYFAVTFHGKYFTSVLWFLIDRKDPFFLTF